MIRKTEIFGTYRAKENNNTDFSNVYELTVSEINQKIKFCFDMRTEGSFGAVGQKWIGLGIYRSDHLALIIEEEKDYTYTKIDNNLSEYSKSKNESLPIEIYTDEGRVIIYHKKIDKYILLLKDKKNDNTKNI